MTRFKLGLLFICLITMVACGEKMKAIQASNTLQAQEDSAATLPGSGLRDAAPSTEQEVLTEDAKVLLSYRSLLENKEKESVVLKDMIKAFDVEIVKSGGHQGSSMSYAVRARLAFGCGNGFAIDNLNITDTQIFSKQRLTLGTQNGYTVAIQCTDNPCNKFVAAITNHSMTTGQSGTVLVGLQGDVSNKNYVNRTVNLPHFHQYQSVENYGIRQCGATSDSVGPQPASTAPATGSPFTAVTANDPFSNHIERNSVPTTTTPTTPIDPWIQNFIDEQKKKEMEFYF